MPALFEPTRPFPLPEGVVIVTKNGKPNAHIGTVLYPLTKDGAKYLKPAASYYAHIAQVDGSRKRVRLSPNNPPPR